MQNRFTKTAAVCAALFAITSCEKDETRVTLQAGTATALTASSSPAVLLQDKGGDKGVTYIWTPVSFGYPAEVTYTLQFDKKGGNFSAPITFGAGTSLTRSFTVSELNSIYVGKNLVGTPSTPTALDVRLKASVSESAPPVYSPVNSITTTPYNFCDQPAAKDAWALIGPAGKGWGDKDDVAMKYDCATKFYTYTGPLKADSFKFRYGGAWKANLGGTAPAGGDLTNDGPDMKIPAAGIYTVTLKPGPLTSEGKASPSTFTITQ